MKNLLRQHRFAGISVGSMLAAVMVWGGITTLILATRDPLAAAVIYLVNSLRYKLNPDMLWIQSPHLSWDLIAAFAVGGVMNSLAGLALGAWLHPSSKEERESS